MRFITNTILRLVVLIFCSSAIAEVRWSQRGCAFPDKIYRGKPFQVYCSQSYIDAFPVTNFDTKRFTVTIPGATLSIGATVQFISSGTTVDSAASGVLPALHNQLTGISVDSQVSADTWRLGWQVVTGSAGRWAEFGSDLGSEYNADPKRLMVGSGVTGGDRTSSVLNISASSPDITLTGVFNVNPNSTRTPMTNVGGVYTSANNVSAILLKFAVSETATPGPASVSLRIRANSTCCTGVQFDRTLNMTMLEPNTLVPWLDSPVTPVPWPPGLEGDLIAVMQQRLSFWCNTTTGKICNGTPSTCNPTYLTNFNGDIDFYDGVRHYGIADQMFPGNRYLDCADNIAMRVMNPSQGGHLFSEVSNNPSAIDSFAFFSRGYGMGARRGKTGGIRWLEMAVKNPGQLQSGLRTISMRPTFFMAEFHRNFLLSQGYSYGAVPNVAPLSTYKARSDDAIEDLLLMMDNFSFAGTTYSTQYSAARGFPYNQNFFVGYTMRELYDHWLANGRSDNRIIYLIKSYIDNIHNPHVWNASGQLLHWSSSVPAPGNGPTWSRTSSGGGGVSGSLTGSCPGPSGCQLTFTACPAVLVGGVDVVYIDTAANTAQIAEIATSPASTCTVVGNPGTINVITAGGFTGTYTVTGNGIIAQGLGCAQNCWGHSLPETGTQLASMSIAFNALLYKLGAGTAYADFYDAQTAAYVLRASPAISSISGATPKITNEDSISTYNGIYWRNLQENPRR